MFEYQTRMKDDLEQEIRWIVRDKYKGNRSNEALVKDIARLKKGEPIDYIVGWKPFLNVTIDLSFKPLIPRPETECWVEQLIAILKKRFNSKSFKVLDIFSGSGCCGVAIAKALPQARVDCADVEPKALLQIRKNIGLNGLLRRVRVVQSNIFQNISGKYDCIVANPPYVSARGMKKIDLRVKKFEPRRALYGGTDGLVTIKKFLNDLDTHLKPQGIAEMEFGSGQKQAVEKIVRNAHYRSEFLKDQFGKWRTVRIFLNDF